MMWECDACKMANGIEATVCGACGHDRFTSMPAKPEGAGGPKGRSAGSSSGQQPCRTETHPCRHGRECAPGACGHLGAT